jgi:hypothetical protein
MKTAHVWLIEFKGMRGWRFIPEEMFKTRRVARIVEREYQDSAKGWGVHYRVAKYIRIGRSEGKP